MTYQNNYECLHFEKKGPIAYITIDNPATLNALSPAIFNSINVIFDEMREDDELRAVILTGAGRSFVAGADLTGKFTYANFGPISEMRKIREYIHATMNKVANFPLPTVAAINGYALGGGAELALCCDFRIASTKAKIGFPECRIGGIPGYTGSARAVKLIGPTAAKKMLMTGNHYTAAECLDMGFVQQVVEPEELIPACESFLADILKRAPLAIRFAKLFVDNSMEMSLKAALDYETHLTSLLCRTEDYKEGRAAFKEKRDPNFQNL